RWPDQSPEIWKHGHPRRLSDEDWVPAYPRGYPTARSLSSSSAQPVCDRSRKFRDRCNSGGDQRARAEAGDQELKPLSPIVNRGCCTTHVAQAARLCSERERGDSAELCSAAQASRLCHVSCDGFISADGYWLAISHQANCTIQHSQRNFPFSSFGHIDGFRWSNDGHGVSLGVKPDAFL